MKSHLKIPSRTIAPVTSASTALILALLLSGGLACGAQQSASQPATSSAPPTPSTATTLKVQVREVVLPVTVRDKKGQIVPSLKIDDFTLEDNAHPQTIKSFTRETNLPFRLGLLVEAEAAP
jgi:hypothetical protein